MVQFTVDEISNINFMKKGFCKYEFPNNFKMAVRLYGISKPWH
jgi:hypothetical protein